MVSLPLALFEQDAELKYTSVHASPPLAGLFVLGKGDDELLPTEETAVLTNLKRSVIETGAPLREEARLSLEGVPTEFELVL
jgi:hypothetical protein